MKRVMIMAAGTGGHIFPGLAIAAALQERGCEVTWLGTTTGMEQTLVPKKGIPLDALDFTGMRGKGIKHTINGLFKMLKSIGQCAKIMRSRRPDVILGMGGYVTVPGGLAAKSLGIPIVLVNADAGLLLSNKLLLPIAKRICFGFNPSTAVSSEKIEVTGNPVRNELIWARPPSMRYTNRIGPLRVLVVGGSLGARVLNETIPQALALLPVEKRPLVTHQTGKGNHAAVVAAYNAAGVSAEVVEFIDDMPARYEDADLVICRAGAITVSELITVGVASILVPLEASTTSHQRQNAQWLSSTNGALHLPQALLSPELLAKQLSTLSRQSLWDIAEKAYALRNVNTTRDIVNILETASKK